MDLNDTMIHIIHLFFKGISMKKSILIAALAGMLITVGCQAEMPTMKGVSAKVAANLVNMTVAPAVYVYAEKLVGSQTLGAMGGIAWSLATMALALKNTFDLGTLEKLGGTEDWKITLLFLCNSAPLAYAGMIGCLALEKISKDLTSMVYNYLEKKPKTQVSDREATTI